MDSDKVKNFISNLVNGLKVFVNTVATSKWINISEVIPTNIGSEEFLTEFIV